MHLNKYFVLEKAMELGLRIPDTLVTSSKIELEEFCENIPSGVITKPLYEVIFFEEKKRSINFRTQLLNTDSFDKLPELFFPSLFQKNIIKNYEIRSFFLKGEIFSMAIFSQQSSKTKIDFRNYDQDYPNRTIPFLLPTEVSSKLIGLFKYLKLDTGSADFIYGLDGCFYFLEINPSGQFGMVSKPCNYYLERLMANKLIDIGK